MRTHDRTAEAAVIKVEYSSIASFLHNHGSGPNGKNPVEEREKFEAAG